VRLNPKTEALIGNEVERGAYSPAEEFVERAVELLHDHEQWLTGNQPAIAAQVDHGFAQAGRGELIDGDEVASILRERRFAGQKIGRGLPEAAEQRGENPIPSASDLVSKHPRHGSVRLNLT